MCCSQPKLVLMMADVHHTPLIVVQIRGWEKTARACANYVKYLKGMHFGLLLNESGERWRYSPMHEDLKLPLTYQSKKNQITSLNELLSCYHNNKIGLWGAVILFLRQRKERVGRCGSLASKRKREKSGSNTWLETIGPSPLYRSN